MQQGRQAVASLANGDDAMEAGTFLVDALVRLAEACDRLARRLDGIELELQRLRP